MCEDCLKKKEPRAKNIWDENYDFADKLGTAYYDSLLEEYDKKAIAKDSKKNFGFNTFCDGIRLGLDIVMPMLDDNGIKEAKKKIKLMLNRRKKADSQAKEDIEWGLDSDK